MTTHKIQVEQVRPGRWRAVCECGQYKSTGYSYKGAAENAGEQHLRAKKVATG